MKKLLLPLLIIAGALSLGHCVDRDIQNEKLYTGDLRNRVVGARLQKDGKLPYYYKWKSSDGVRYYDPQNFNSVTISNITASPFFHNLLFPIAEMPQRSISYFWLYLQYILLAVMTGAALLMATAGEQKAGVMALAVSFLFTATWIHSIAAGQLYLFIPLLAMLFYFFLCKSKYVTSAFLAGLFAVCLVLVRPNSVLFFLPFLFIAGKFSVRYKIIFLVPVLLLLVYSFGNSFQRNLWIEYGQNISEQIKMHQGEKLRAQENEKDPHLASWEGWDMVKAKKENDAAPQIIFSENGNVFVLVRNLFGIKLSTTFLTVASFSLIFLIMILFYFWRRPSGFGIYNLAILGFCLYMLSDFFSPVYRHQYYTVQWFFPLFLAAAGFVKNYKLIYMALAVGVILNITNLSFVKMEHTIGEYIIFAALLLLAFVYNNPSQLKNEIDSYHH